MDLRPYQPADRDACLAVFDSNTPDFFQSHPRLDFEEFLDGPHRSYFVMEQDGAIAGCGGYVINREKALARLGWGMVRREWRRQGLGRFLLLFRLREIAKAGGVQMVHLDAPRHAAAFFESQGFKVLGIAKDGYGAGLDRVEMSMKLTVCP